MEILFRISLSSIYKIRYCQITTFPLGNQLHRSCLSLHLYAVTWLIHFIFILPTNEFIPVFHRSCLNHMRFTNFNNFLIIFLNAIRRYSTGQIIGNDSPVLQNIGRSITIFIKSPGRIHCYIFFSKYNLRDCFQFTIILLINSIVFLCCPANENNSLSIYLTMHWLFV